MWILFSRLQGPPDSVEGCQSNADAGAHTPSALGAAENLRIQPGSQNPHCSSHLGTGVNGSGKMLQEEAG